MMASNQVTKLNALLEQKIEMVEASLKDTKEQLKAKEQECRDLVKDSMKLKKENAKLQDERKKDEKMYTDQIRKLTEKFEKENLALSSRSKSSSGKASKEEIDYHMKTWKKEKELLEKQLKMQVQQNEENKRMQEDLMQAFKTMENSKSDIQTTNDKLSDLIQRSDTRNVQLEEKLGKYRKYKKIIESASLIQCMHCDQKIKPKEFTKHMQVCPPQEDPFLMQQKPLNLEILEVKKLTDEEMGYAYCEYEIGVDYRERNYVVRKKINLFLTLYDNLEQHFPGLQMPQVPEIFNTYGDDRQQLKEEGFYAENYSEELSKLLNFFCHHPVIKESVFFKKFLEIDKEFPDEFSKARNKKSTSFMPKNRATLQAAQSITSFDLMPDGYIDSVLSPKGSSRGAMSMARESSHNAFSPSQDADFDTDDEEA